MIAIINQIVKVKYISQKLLLIRFNSFIATDFRFGFSFGSDFIFLKFELQFLDRILDLFFILDIKTEKTIEKCVEKCVETANYYTTTGSNKR